MAKEKSNKKSLSEKLISKYRLVIMDDNTFEEKASFVLSRLNIYILITAFLVLQLLVLTGLIIFTPLKQYIPGYMDINMRRDLTMLKLKSDSLERIINNRDMYIENMRNILIGKIDTIDPYVDRELKLDTVYLSNLSLEDSMLRAEMEQDDKYKLLNVRKKVLAKELKNIHYFTPIKGLITSDFNPAKEHYGIDIVATEDEPVKSVLDGTIIFSSWTLETGYIIAIQHANDMFSFYKHNSVLLKKVGSFVKAGEVIAIIGSSGELTTGPHLHFELWHKGIAVNPKELMVF